MTKTGETKMFGKKEYMLMYSKAKGYHYVKATKNLKHRQTRMCIAEKIEEFMNRKEKQK